MRSLVFHPSERTAPREVIQHLREIDPTFELVWVVSAWVLGRVRPTALRYIQGGRMLKAALGYPNPDPDLVQYARLAMQGFAPTESYDFTEADSRIVEDARIRFYNLQNRADAVFAERLDESLGGPRMRDNLSRVRTGADNLAGDSWRRAFKRPVYSRPYNRSVFA